MMRVLAAVAVLVSAAVHLWLWFDGYRDVDVIGPSFLLNAVGGVVIAVLLLTWRHWIPPFLAVGFGLSTMGGFVISATVGLFGLHESWQGWAVWTAAASEVVAVLAGLALLLEALRERSQHSQGHSQGHSRGHSQGQPQHDPAVGRTDLH